MHAIIPDERRARNKAKFGVALLSYLGETTSGRFLNDYKRPFRLIERRLGAGGLALDAVEALVTRIVLPNKPTRIDGKTC